MPRIIRLATLDDAERIRDIYAPYCRTPISFEADPPGIDEMRSRMKKLDGEYPWFVCEDDGVLVGYAYGSRHRERAAYRWSVETTVYIDEHCHRRGIGRALYEVLFKVLPIQGFVGAFAGVTIPNPGSVGLHLAMGFTQVGIYHHIGYKLGSWHDVAWFGRLLQPPQTEPAEPKRLDAVQHSAAWQETFAQACSASPAP